MIEVTVVRSPFRFGDDVWIWRRENGGTQVLTADGGSWAWVHQGDAKQPDPSLRIPEGCREVLGAALLGTSMPTDSMAAHLKDAVAVRDRLLILVERAAHPPWLDIPPGRSS
jgi:hypothetical protein